MDGIATSGRDDDTGQDVERDQAEQEGRVGEWLLVGCFDDDGDQEGLFLRVCIVPRGRYGRHGSLVANWGDEGGGRGRRG